MMAAPANVLNVAPALVTITRPAYLVAQYREADAERTRLYGLHRDLTEGEEAQLDAAEQTASEARAALREMVAVWGCSADQFAEALS